MNLKQRLKPKSILVIGDVMLDVYSSGDVKRISPEAPVPVFKKLSERYAIGGAGNVAANLAAAGQRVSLMSVIGHDADGDTLIDELCRQSIGTDLVLRSQTRRTTVKTRFITSSRQQVFRQDVEDTQPLQKDEYSYFENRLAACITRFNLIIISDYMKGLLTFDFTQKIIEIANKANIRILIDVKDTNLNKYKGAFLLKPNLLELQNLTGKSVREYTDIAATSAELCRLCNCSYVLTTCGARGMVLADAGGEYQVVESTPVEVYDVTGAGDTAIAYLGACLANGFDISEALLFSNIAAGIQVTKSGTTPIHASEIDEWIEKKDKNNTGEYKVIDRSLLGNIKKNNSNKRIVFTNGCFDILHLGHVKYLRQAASFGDILVIGVNSDDSVKRLKGAFRPVNGESERAQLLASLEFVNYVIIFDEDTPYNLISELMPDVLAKGADYAPEDVVGRELVEQNGGKLVLIPLVEGKSTTNIIEKITGGTENQ